MCFCGFAVQSPREKKVNADSVRGASGLEQGTRSQTVTGSESCHDGNGRHAEPRHDEEGDTLLVDNPDAEKLLKVNEPLFVLEAPAPDIPLLL